MYQILQSNNQRFLLGSSSSNPVSPHSPPPPLFPHEPNQAYNPPLTPFKPSHPHSFASSLTAPTFSFGAYFFSTPSLWYFQNCFDASLPATRFRILAPPGCSSMKPIFWRKKRGSLLVRGCFVFFCFGFLVGGGNLGRGLEGESGEELNGKEHLEKAERKYLSHHTRSRLLLCIIPLRACCALLLRLGRRIATSFSLLVRWTSWDADWGYLAGCLRERGACWMDVFLGFLEVD